MSLKAVFILAWRSLCFRRGALFISVAAIAVSVFSLLSVEHIRQTVKHSFTSTVSGADLIVGPRTSGIQLLLTTVFRIGHPLQNMSWQSYQQLARDPSVAWIIPISLGDSHRGFRVVGTEQQFFSRFQYGQSRALSFANGKGFSGLHEVVLGASVARQLHYTQGQRLVIAHGLGNASFQTHDKFPFRVSGILKPTGTPVDNALYVSLAGLESIHQPAVGHHTEVNHSHFVPKSISAAIIGLRSKLSTFKMQRSINASKSEPLTAILPGVTLTQLWQISKGVEGAVALLAALILLASLLGLAAVMVASLRERNYELSILRTLGAGSLTIFVLIELETLLISMLGIIIGGGVFFLGTLLFGEGLALATGIDITTGQLSPAHGLLLLYVILSAQLVGMLPALTGYFRSRNI